MEKSLKRILAVLLSFALMLPVTYFESVPVNAQNSILYIVAADYSKDQSVDNPEIQNYFYSDRATTAYTVNPSWKGITYDSTTNTMTFENVNMPALGILFDCDQQDVTFVAKGTNSIGNLEMSASTITFEGTGTLNINAPYTGDLYFNNKETLNNENPFANALTITYVPEDDSLSKPLITVGKDVTLNLYAANDLINIYWGGSHNVTASKLLSYGGKTEPEPPVWTDEITENNPQYETYASIYTGQVAQSVYAPVQIPVNALYMYSYDSALNDHNFGADINLDTTVSENTATIRFDDDGVPYAAFIVKKNGKWQMFDWGGVGIRDFANGTLYDRQFTQRAADANDFLTADISNGTLTVYAFVGDSGYKAKKGNDENYFYFKKSCFPKAITETANLASPYYLAKLTKSGNDAYLGELKGYQDDTSKPNFTNMKKDGYSPIGDVHEASYSTTICLNGKVQKFFPAASTQKGLGDDNETTVGGDNTITVPGQTGNDKKEDDKKEDDKKEEDTAEKEPVDLGAKKTEKGITYQVTSNEKGKAEAAFTGLTKKNRKKPLTVKIPKTVNVNGVKCKVTKIDKKALAGTYVKKVVIPDTVKTIDTEAFSKCKNLKIVDIPKNVEEIKDGAFSGCANLKKVKFKGKKLKKLNKNAFRNCPKLESMELPKSVTSIGAGAFAGDTKLMTFKINSTKLKSVGAGAFNKVPAKAKCKVPKKMLKKYKTLLNKKGGFKGKVIGK